MPIKPRKSTSNKIQLGDIVTIAYLPSSILNLEVGMSGKVIEIIELTKLVFIKIQLNTSSKLVTLPNDYLKVTLKRRK
jgi:hypothetical protein